MSVSLFVVLSSPGVELLCCILFFISITVLLFTLPIVRLKCTEPARSITTLLEVSLPEVSLPEASLPEALLTLSKPSVVSRLLVAATLSRPFLTTDGSKVDEFANVNKNVSNSTVGDCDNCSVRVGRVTAPSSPPTSTTSEPCSRNRSSQDAGGAQADDR